MQYDVFIDSYIGYPVTADYVRSALAAAPAGRPANVLVCSPGGDVSEALAIRQAFLDHPAGVTCWVYGLTASAATLLLTGSADVRISPAALMLIHPCHTYVEQRGLYNAEQLAEAIAALQGMQAGMEQIDRLVASAYAARTGQTAERLQALMREERWLTPAEAVELGLCDSIIDEQALLAAAPDGGETPEAAAVRHFKMCGLPAPPSQAFLAATRTAGQTQAAPAPSAGGATPPPPQAAAPAPSERAGGEAAAELERLGGLNASLTAQVAALQTRRAELEAQVQALQALDGAADGDPALCEAARHAPVTAATLYGEIEALL